MDGRPGRLTSTWRRLRDPITLRKVATVTLPALAVAVGLGTLLGGDPGRVLVVLGWVLLLPVAVALGYGESFFVGHGRGVRRATGLLIVSAVASLLGCAMVSLGFSAGEGLDQRLLRLIVMLVLFVAVGLFVASLAALGFGLGTGYLARKIAERSSDEWP